MVNIDVGARSLAFRLDETRAGVTKYYFFLIKMSDECPAHLSRPLYKTVRTPHRKLCLGKYEKLRNDSSADPKQSGWRLLAEESWLKTPG